MTTAVIIPIRNRAALLKECIQSIDDQTRPIDEIIIIDDGSTDDTPATIAALAAADPRIVSLRNETSRGAATARNMGIAEAKAEWISFLDSDDRWLPDKHDRQIRRLAEMPGAVASFTGHRLVYPDHVRDRPLAKTVTLDELREGNIIGTTSSAMVRGAVLKQLGGFDDDLPSCQDWDLWLRLRAIGDFALVPDCLLDFTQGSSDRISRNHAAVMTGHAIVFPRALAGVRGRLKRRQITAHHRIRFSEIYQYDVQRPVYAFAYAVRALWCWPGHQSRRVFRNALNALAGRDGNAKQSQ